MAKKTSKRDEPFISLDVARGLCSGYPECCVRHWVNVWSPAWDKLGKEPFGLSNLCPKHEGVFTERMVRRCHPAPNGAVCACNEAYKSFYKENV